MENAEQRVKKKGLVKTVLIIASVAFVFAWILEGIQLVSMPKEYEYLPSEDCPKIKPGDEQISGLYNYIWEEGSLTTTGDDPQIYIETEGMGEIYGITLYYGQPLEADFPIQLFYALEKGAYSETESIKTTCKIGEEKTFFSIPVGVYPQLRVDIDGIEEKPISAIQIVNEKPSRNIINVHPRFERVAIMTILLCAVLFWLWWCKAWKRLKKTISGGIQGIKEQGTKIWIRIGIFLLIIVVIVALYWMLFCKMANAAMTTPRLVFAILLGLFTACILTFRKTLTTQPEYLFLVLVLCSGFLFSYFVPHTGLNSWDEDYHYLQTLKLSYVGEGRYTPQDEKTIVRVLVEPSWDWSGGGVEKIHSNMDKEYAADIRLTRGIPTINSLPEIPNAIGLFIGRALGLRYYMIHFMGRFFGLIAYGIIGFFAIRKLKSGKMIAAVCLLIPTNIFLASSYNYDSYLTGFSILGLCYYIAQWQERDKKLSLQDALIMLFSFFLGCLSKFIYFPLMWIAVLLPRTKFHTTKEHKAYIFSFLAATGLLFFSYVLPMLIVSGGISVQSDSRGGETVSGIGQLQYILSNPIEGLGVLWQYMIGSYFNLNRVGEVITNYAYHGIGRNQYLYLLLIVVVAFTDKNEHDRELVHHPWAHLWPIIVSIGTVFLVIASMYIIFTPVGASEVQGAQFRYLIPMIFPVCIHIGSGLLNNKMNRGWYNGLVLSIAAYVIFSNLHDLFIARYI